MQRNVILLSLMSFIVFSSISVPYLHCAVAEQVNPIEKLARSHFRRTLSDCEKRLLLKVSTGEFAYCGGTHTAADPVPGDAGSDSANKPRRPDEIESKLIRWLLTDPQSVKQIDARGIRVSSARITGDLDLSNQKVPLPLNFLNCRFTGLIDLSFAQVPMLELSGSSVRLVNADGVTVRGDIAIDDGFEARQISLRGAHIGGDLNGKRAAITNSDPCTTDDALNGDRLQVDGAVLLDHLRSEGGVIIHGAHIGGDFRTNSATIRKTGGVAVDATGTTVMGTVFLKGQVAEGHVRFIRTYIGGDLDLSGAKFDESRSCRSKPPQQSGLFTQGATIKGQLTWSGIKWSRKENGILDLTNTNVGSFYEDEGSGPIRGNLALNGFTYGRFLSEVPDIGHYLRWLKRQLPASRINRPRFTPQPYEQLAKVLRDAGDDAGAKSVLIAMENARWSYGDLGFWQRSWSFMLWLTIGYGYEPFLALGYIVFFVTLGALLFFWGEQSGAISQTDKEKPEHYRPFSSFVYSLETFLPIVDLRQAKHWAPDPEPRESRQVRLAAFWPLSKYQCQLGRNFGRFLRRYLWLHILMGWFFTLMLVAGFSGLVQKG